MISRGLRRAQVAACVAAVIGATATLPDMPNPEPSPAIAYAAVKRTLSDGFHFVETDVVEPFQGAIEEGDWHPPAQFQKRIDRTDVRDREMVGLFYEQRDIGVDRYGRRDGDDTWLHTTRSRLEGHIGGYQVDVLRRIRISDIRPTGDFYEISGGDEPRTRFQVRGGHVVLLRDAAGYETVYSAFGRTAAVTRPTNVKEDPDRRFEVPLNEAASVAASYYEVGNPEASYRVIGEPLAFRTSGLTVAMASREAADERLGMILLAWHRGRYVGLVEPHMIRGVSIGIAGGLGHYFAVTYSAPIDSGSTVRGSAVDIRYRFVSGQLSRDRPLPANFYDPTIEVRRR